MVFGVVGRQRDITDFEAVGGGPAVQRVGHHQAGPRGLGVAVEIRVAGRGPPVIGGHGGGDARVQRRAGHVRRCLAAGALAVAIAAGPERDCLGGRLRRIVVVPNIDRVARIVGNVGITGVVRIRR